jgi:diguanylate cyclase
MCVNLSMRQLQDPYLVDKVEGALRRAALDANELKLEITETAVMEDEQHVISVLRDLGVRIALGDFGSGYSALHCVKDLPVDDLKIDKSFIDGLENTVNDAIVRMPRGGSRLSRRTVAACCGVMASTSSVSSTIAALTHRAW